jgi:hypothetical protein
LTSWNAGTKAASSITAQFPLSIKFVGVQISANALPTSSETYTISGSNDGVTFTTITSGTRTVTYPGVVHTLAPFFFAEVNYRYLRVGVGALPTSWIAINEVKLLLSAQEGISLLTSEVLALSPPLTAQQAQVLTLWLNSAGC